MARNIAAEARRNYPTYILGRRALTPIPEERQDGREDLAKHIGTAHITTGVTTKRGSDFV
jgi:hypothetical protein